ncbi:hypothetical protein OXX80_004559 [Metschnikowia pulcherrima]|uniref:Uncharacterized protein n=2 Tax=Metschnikowia TaxID=27320 RepID=A0A4P6XQD0_9ASCO|nr:hypothetical protein HF325_001721 [Metschnikowia pulcherrima]KAJ8142854.1 hypothetical protein OY671_004013 [Metschnikowia pulcherrima]QBM89229.1 hypothetical protein METSCH_D02930 [Metschnikowia aff. pulcherrima]
MAVSKPKGSYPQSRFRAVLAKKTSHRIAKDNTDMLVYLVYMDYLSKLLHRKDGTELTERSIEEAHEKLMKQYKG